MDKIRTELEALFDEMLPELKNFKKKKYAEVFEMKYEEHRDLFKQISRILEDASAEERPVLIEEIASIIPNYAYQKMPRESKSQIERNSLDYNMTMASYIIPLVGYARDEYSKTLAKAMVKSWNKKKVTSLTLSYSTYEEISEGFKKSLFSFLSR